MEQNICKLISFYTENTIYEKEIETLESCCAKLRIPHYIEKRKDLGSWQKNCSQKPLFIHECLEKFQEPLFWVDADALVLRPLHLQLPPCDMALYFNCFKTKHARNGTIYISPTEGSKKFLLQWYEELQNINTHTPTPDQPVMIELLQKTSLHIEKLPLSYSLVFDRDPLPLDQTVILHFQASRSRQIPPFLWEQYSGLQLKLMRLRGCLNLSE